MLVAAELFLDTIIAVLAALGYQVQRGKEKQQAYREEFEKTSHLALVFPCIGKDSSLCNGWMLPQ